MSANQRSIKGDFIGFTLGNVHSSELGLVRVSDGSRYNEDLLPPLQDKKAQVAGRDGEIYFGSQYVTKPIKVPVAFDNMTEKNFSDLRRLLSNKTPQVLRFDETPYKQWVVKSANAQSFKWICFDETRNGGEPRIYKGEGTIEFNCFDSWASSTITFLDEVIDSYDTSVNPQTPIYKPGFENWQEWSESSGLKNREGNILHISSVNNTTTFDFDKVYTDFKIDKYPRKGIFAYNAGDRPIKPQIIFKIPQGYEMKGDLVLRLHAFNNSLKTNNTEEKFREMGDMILSKDFVNWYRTNIANNEDIYIIVDSKLKMIKGAKYKNGNLELNGLIYNKYHKSGDYIQLPVSKEDIYFIELNELYSTENTSIAQEEGEENTEEKIIEMLSVKYNHQYY